MTPKFFFFSIFSLKRAFASRMSLNTLRQSYLRTQISKNDVNSKLKQTAKKTTSVFSFWLTAGENIDFVTKYFDNSRLLETI